MFSNIDKLSTVDEDEVKKNQDMKKLMMDMKLIDSDHMWNKILEDDNVRKQIYAYIESVGGIERARQSVARLHNRHQDEG